MHVYFNELAVHGQFEIPFQFEQLIQELLMLRREAQQRKAEFFCSSNLQNRPISSKATFQKAVTGLSNRDHRALILRWITEYRWENHPDRHSPEEFYFYNGELITDHSIAEAAYQTSNGKQACLFSFQSDRYNDAILNVERVDGEEQTLIETMNAISYLGTKEVLDRWCEEARNLPLNSWHDLIQWGQANCLNLHFADYILESLGKRPFSIPIAEQSRTLLSILDEIASAFDENGKRTARGHQLHNEHFEGRRARFSPESQTNQRLFQKELTFPHPESSGEQIFCDWHGKISVDYFRIHFSWPPQHGKKLYVVYIGPKITKS